MLARIKIWYLIIGFTLLMLTVGTSHAQVLATIPILGNGNHDAHDYSFGPFTVPPNASFYRVVFDSNDQLIGDQTMTVVVNRSLTGGGSPEPAGGAVFTSLVQPTSFANPIPQRTAPGRVLEGRITIYGGRWKGKAFIEIE